MFFSFIKGHNKPLNKGHNERRQYLAQNWMQDLIYHQEIT